MPNVKVYLAIYSESISPQRITRVLGIKPTKSKKKGQPISKLIKRPAPHSYWLYEPQADYPEWVEEKIDFLLSRLEPIKSNLGKIAPHATMRINICYEGYKDWMSGIVLNKEQITSIAAMGLSIDIDLYASGPDLPE